MYLPSRCPATFGGGGAGTQTRCSHKYLLFFQNMKPAKTCSHEQCHRYCLWCHRTNGSRFVYRRYPIRICPHHWLFWQSLPSYISIICSLQKQKLRYSLPSSIRFPNSQQIQRRTNPAVEIRPFLVLKNNWIYNKRNQWKSFIATISGSEICCKHDRFYGCWVCWDPRQYTRDSKLLNVQILNPFSQKWRSGPNG
jgi:hypothetical protein